MNHNVYLKQGGQRRETLF